MKCSRDNSIPYNFHLRLLTIFSEVKEIKMVAQISTRSSHLVGHDNTRPYTVSKLPELGLNNLRYLPYSPDLTYIDR